MKKIVLAILLLSCLLHSGCKDESVAIDPLRNATILLSKTWETAYVSVDNTDVTDFGYSLMQLSFTEGGTWTATNANGLFADGGGWEFAENDASRLILSGRETRIVLNPEGSTLTIRFERVGNEVIGGRTSQSGGNYEVYLLPKFVP